MKQFLFQRPSGAQPRRHGFQTIQHLSVLVLVAGSFLAWAAGTARAQTNAGAPGPSIIAKPANTNTVRSSYTNVTILPPIPLWPEGAPGALGKADKDTPTLTPYFPERAIASRAAIVICPGGGYGGLAQHEGANYARWLCENGVAGLVLKYRLGSQGYHHPAMLQDVTRALRLVRSRASEWQLDTNRIGVMGSSAGGHLASTLLTHFDTGLTNAEDPIERVSCRPDLGILCYPVVSMSSPFTHTGSRRNLLGTNQPPELLKFLSSELQVTAQTPPCFLFHTWEDQGVKVENTLEFAVALRRAGVPFDLHIYEQGAHGLGLGGREYPPAAWHPWTADCIYWLKAHGFHK